MRRLLVAAAPALLLGGAPGCHLVSGVTEWRFSDGGDAGTAAPCEGDALSCQADGSAAVCVAGAWEPLGSCPLGCDEATGACRVPSNVDPEVVGAGVGDVTVEPEADPLTFDTDTGEVRAGAEVVRPAGVGLDDDSGIAFLVEPQAAGEPDLGVFSLTGLTVRRDATLRGIGAGALVLVVAGEVEIAGTVAVAAEGSEAGPGGYPGGSTGAPGGGPCAGEPGVGASVASYCTSGSAGGGHGAPGGDGGPSTCAPPDDYPGGAAGGVCGAAALVPLVGGSGGAGGSLAAGGDSHPGPGGGGGGALQISAGGSITVRSTGRIHAGGGGGAAAVSGGGSGGGAGGAILLEAPTVTVAVGAILAANGGGGGGGDCT